MAQLNNSTNTLCSFKKLTVQIQQCFLTLCKENYNHFICFAFLAIVSILFWKYVCTFVVFCMFMHNYFKLICFGDNDPHILRRTEGFQQKATLIFQGCNLVTFSMHILIFFSMDSHIHTHHCHEFFSLWQKKHQHTVHNASAHKTHHPITPLKPH